MKHHNSNSIPLIIGFGKGRGLEECSRSFNFPDSQMIQHILNPKIPYYRDESNNIICVKARHSDLNWMLRDQHINVAVASSVWFDSEDDQFSAYKLDNGFTKPCRLSLISREPMLLNETMTIATKFPGIAKKYFEKKGLNLQVVHMSGCHENALMLGFADAIIDIIETGNTIKRMGFTELDILQEVSHKLYINNRIEDCGLIHDRLKTYMNLWEEKLSYRA